jgi:hypothetical protein
MKAQEMIVKALELKLVTRTEIANLIGVHADTVSGFKTGKKAINEKMESTIISTLIQNFPEEFAPKVEVKAEEPKTDEEVKITDVAALANYLNVSERKLRRILRGMFGKQGGKAWDLSTLTSEQQSELESKALKGRKGE